MLEFNTLEFSCYLMKTRIIAMIPARVGSERLKMKNLALINGKPLIYHLTSLNFQQIIVNLIGLAAQLMDLENYLLIFPIVLVN